MSRRSKITVVLFLIFLISQNIFAATNYVSKTGAHISPFDSWLNAATNIQDAINVATASDMVLVNDGTYYPASQISITKEIVVKSVNDAEKTIVDGNQAHRCVSISKGIIDGFTITNGHTQSTFDGNGGGVICGGGIVQNCIISGNGSANGGGGVSCSGGGIVRDCIISKNWTDGQYSDGGGVNCGFVGTLENCIIRGNYSTGSGGGIECYGCNVKNCLVIDNFAESSGGGMNISYSVNTENCTVVGNSAFKIREITGGSFTDEYTGGVSCTRKSSSVQNSILWSNRNGNRFSDESKNFYNCIQNWTNLVDGIITNNPQFISDNDFRLQSTSSCRNSGTNMSWMSSSTDLDGNPRIVGGRVDMGAYEFVPEPGMLWFAGLLTARYIMRTRRRA